MDNTKKFFIGLDISTNTGVAVLSVCNDKIALESFSTVTENKNFLQKIKKLHNIDDCRFLKRAERIANKVFNIIKKYKNSTVCIEQTNQLKSRQTQKLLEFIHFAILKKLINKHRIIYVNTVSWRKFHNIFSIKKKKKINLKNASIVVVNDLFKLNLTFKDHNAAEAVLIGYYAILKYSNSQQGV